LFLWCAQVYEATYRAKMQYKATHNHNKKVVLAVAKAGTQRCIALQAEADAAAGAWEWVGDANQYKRWSGGSAGECRPVCVCNQVCVSLWLLGFSHIMTSPLLRCTRLLYAAPSPLTSCLGLMRWAERVDQVLAGGAGGGEAGVFHAAPGGQQAPVEKSQLAEQRRDAVSMPTGTEGQWESRSEGRGAHAALLLRGGRGAGVPAMVSAFLAGVARVMLAAGKSQWWLIPGRVVM
jgi:hypothetical protein